MAYVESCACSSQNANTMMGATPLARGQASAYLEARAIGVWCINSIKSATTMVVNRRLFSICQPGTTVPNGFHIAGSNAGIRTKSTV
jgi:hypothetical protein